MSTLEEPPRSRWRWPLYAAGSAMVAFGLWGELFGADTNPLRWAELLVVAALAHDLVLAPVVITLGVATRRLLPSRLRSAVQGAWLVSAVLLLVAIPGLGRFGAKADNPSVLPRDYPTGLAVGVGTVVLVTAILVLLRQVRQRR